MTGPGTYLAVVLYTLPGFVIGSVIHELSHGAIALRCGDPTPRRDGRMTLDPRRNIDAFGCAAMLIAGIGWGRPVALDPLFLRDPRRRAAVAAVGPLAHLVVAAIFALALRVELTRVAAFDAGGFDILAQFTLQGVIFGVLLQGFLVNIALFVFNAVPLPGLDGYAVLRSLLFGRVPRVLPLRRAVPLRAVRAGGARGAPAAAADGGERRSLLGGDVGASSLTFEHLVVPGVSPIFLGLPNVFTLFQ